MQNPTSATVAMYRKKSLLAIWVNQVPLSSGRLSFDPLSLTPETEIAGLPSTGDVAKQMTWFESSGFALLDPTCQHIRTRTKTLALINLIEQCISSILTIRGYPAVISLRESG
jgi:hypothetical protein